jgi:ADP-ribose pyrophosphatase YjhB (NUDIX family)
VSRRIDFYDDPAAPQANSVVPSANVVVVNDAGEILLIRRTDNDNWALPGGAMDLYPTPRSARLWKRPASRSS